MAVPSPPRLAGERKPSTAKTIVMTVMQKVCAPVPTRTESIIGFCGGRKTSPWTSFQPVSSSTSSAASMALYRLKSRCSVRIRIMATMPERKRTIISELTIENQWICSSPISKYVSQREAHLMSDTSHFTSYVKTASAAPLMPSGVDTAPPHVESCVSAPLHVPEYECLIEDGSTSKPTMRDPSKLDGSLWNLTVRSRWLLRYALPTAVPGISPEPRKPRGKPRS
mmetsp:Transcript_29154/g.91270  ORF Transcript_29154/g.91270 Transcript_29154/m.91270 type:complete len:225 (+) Transcript_29154:337-1011(+)